ncbi:serine/threonine-protein kinase [Isosphaeraceae bacterium EP7]
MPRLDEFVENLTRSALVKPDDLERARAAVAPTENPEAAVRLARHLISKDLLTSYQARKILAGATRGFFVGGYTILRPLGEGGMGKVYLARGPKRGDLVAIKVLPPKRAQEDEQSLLRFQREMELSTRVNHPNLARTFEVGNEGDVYFMVMEYIPGDSLYHVVKSDDGGPLRVPDAARFFLKILDGLEAAHGGGLVHRDIKPSNIMVTPEGDAKILDLGLARDMDEEAHRLTKTNTVIGTLDYASPEQLGNASHADRRSDLYSLGCTLYFTLAGRPPFEGGDVVNKIFKQRMVEADPLETVARGVPSTFGAIVRKLMAKEPDHRYQSAAELRVDLARWTDPAIVRAILGAEADAARAFRPPPPELDDDELRLLMTEDSGISLANLRDLGDPTPAPAPMSRPLPKPRSAVIVNPRDTLRPKVGADANQDDSRWLYAFILVAVLLGIAVILVITVFR